MDVLQQKFGKRLSEIMDVCIGELCGRHEGGGSVCVLCGGQRARGLHGVGWKVELKINKLYRKERGSTARNNYNVQQSSSV